MQRNNDHVQKTHLFHCDKATYISIYPYSWYTYERFLLRHRQCVICLHVFMYDTDTGWSNSNVPYVCKFCKVEKVSKNLETINNRKTWYKPFYGTQNHRIVNKQHCSYNIHTFYVHKQPNTQNSWIKHRFVHLEVPSLLLPCTFSTWLFWFSAISFFASAVSCLYSFLSGIVCYY